MKRYLLLLLLATLGCEEGRCEELPARHHTSSYICSTEQAKEVKELTKACQAKAGEVSTSTLNKCFENAIFVTCSLKKIRCRPEY